MTEAVEKFEVNGYRVEIFPDEDPVNADPRDADNLGIMVATGHKRYTLGDEPHTRTIGEYEDARALVELVWQREITPEEMVARLKEEFGATVVLPLWLLDHSGLSMRTGPFHEDAQQWDSGVVGFIFDTAKTREATGVEEANVEEALRGEVAEYSLFLEGDVYGYVVSDPDGDEVESCWGFLGSRYVEEAAREAAEALPAPQWVVVRGGIKSSIQVEGPYADLADAELAAASYTPPATAMVLKPPSHSRESTVVSGTVPSSWMGITRSMSAESNLRLLAAVDERGVDHADLDAVRRVWEEITDAG